jgi:hypothetical protein
MLSTHLQMARPEIGLLHFHRGTTFYWIELIAIPSRSFVWRRFDLSGELGVWNRRSEGSWTWGIVVPGRDLICDPN